MALFTLALAGALNPAIARVFGYLLDVTEAADPTPALAATLFELTGQPPPGPDSALLRWLLAEPVVPGRDAFAYSTGWRADTLLLRALAGPGGGRRHRPAAADWASGTIGRIVEPPPGPVMRPEALEEIVGFVQQLGQRGEAGLPIEIELAGAAGSGRTALAAQAAARLGSRLVAVDAATLASRADALAAATREARRARLDGSILAWEHADALPAGLWRAIPAAPLTFFSVETPLAEPGRPPGTALDPALGPMRSDRPPRTAAAVGVARRHPASHCGRRVGAAACRDPRRRARRRGWRPRGRRGVPAAADGRHPGPAEPLPLPFTWADLVLSPATTAHLRELEAQAANRAQVLDDWRFSRLTSLGRGTTALFAGPSGTGKTMAAQVLARSLGLDLYRVDLAGVVSKYIGETEKHLRELFEACERAPVLLLFDEADALFGKRTQVSDAHDRYANIEIDYCSSGWSSSTASPSSPRTARGISTPRSSAACASSSTSRPRIRTSVSACGGSRSKARATSRTGPSSASSTGRAWRVSWT